MTPSNCIPDQVLSAFLEGQLSDEESALWENHLLSCSQCLERTRSLHAAHTVANAADGHDVPKGREAWSAEALGSPAMAELIRRLSDRGHLEAIAAQSLQATSAESPTVRPETESVTDNPATRTAAPASAAPQPMLLEAGALLGPYRILAKLGEGGMGAVYKAIHTKLDKVVAVKVLSPQVTRQSDAVTRFEREMRAVGKLTHPHIVQAFDAGEINGTHYLAMEFVEGSDLLQLVKQHGPLSVVNACKAIRQSALALAAAHEAGLVHRDIKPSNLLVSKNGQIKLLDLGLARLADDTHASAELTTAGQAFGTPDYMAPEQWEDAHSADARTDLYALGCTLYYLLAGRPPYGIDKYRTAVGKMKAHVTDSIPDLPPTRQDVPAEVIAIYRRLIAKSPKDRFQTAAELAEALTPFVSSKGAVAAAPTNPAPVAAVNAAPPLGYQTIGHRHRWSRESRWSLDSPPPRRRCRRRSGHAAIGSDHHHDHQQGRDQDEDSSFRRSGNRSRCRSRLESLDHAVRFSLQLSTSNSQRSIRLAGLARRCSETSDCSLRRGTGEETSRRMGGVSQSAGRVHEFHRHEVPADPAG